MKTSFKIEKKEEEEKEIGGWGRSEDGGGEIGRGKKRSTAAQVSMSDHTVPLV